MSYTEIFSFNKDGIAEHEAEVKNAFRGAMAVWKHLFEKHLKGNGYEVMPYMDMQPIWDLQNNERLSDSDLICLLSTFDNVVVKKENLNLLIQAFEEFKGNSSLREQAKIIKGLLEKDCTAVGWNQTSVNWDTWGNYNHKLINEEEDEYEYHGYNLNESKEHWFLFDSFYEKRPKEIIIT